MDWSFPVLYNCPEFVQTHVHWVSDAIQPSHLLSSPSPPSFFLSQYHWLFSSESGGQSTGTSAWASVLPMDIQGSIQGWFPLGFGALILQSKGQSSLPQNCSSKTSILQCSAFLMAQISHPCMPTGKIIALTTQTFVGKVMALIFNLLSRFVIAFLPSSKRL